MNTHLRAVPDWPGYWVDADGGVWSSKRGGELRRLRVTLNDGYEKLSLSHRGEERTFMVHRLVLLSWVGPCPEGCETRHLNGVRTDNRLENLAWGTRRENYQDKLEHGTATMPVLRGENAPGARLSRNQVLEIRRRCAEGERRAALAEEFGVSRRQIGRIVTGDRWKELG